MGKAKEKVEYRYYETPQDIPLLALLGEEWDRVYGLDNEHFHNILEVGYCYEGEGTIVFPEGSLPYEEGTVTIIPGKIVHRTNPVGNPVNRWEYLFIDADRFFYESFSERPLYAKLLIERLNDRSLILQKNELPGVEKILMEIFDEMRGKEEFYRVCAKQLALAFLLRIVRMNTGNFIQREYDPGKERLDTIITALDYIDEHYAENFRIGDIALACGLSETHFRREFHKYINTSPNEYVNLVRIAKACEILSRSNEKIDVVALKTGFLNAATFIRNFKRIIGTTPHQWREEARKNKNNPVNFKVSVLKGY